MSIEELHEKKNYLNELQLRKLITDENKLATLNNTILIQNRLEDYKKEVILPSSIEAKDELRIKNSVLAANYMGDHLFQNNNISEMMVKDMHELLMTDILVGGIYRNSEIAISGTDYIPPTPQIAYQLIKDFYYYLDKKSSTESPLQVAAYSLLEFVNIHPFIDGNGRTARLLMNYCLLENGFCSIIITKENKSEYLDRIRDCQIHHTIYEIEEFICHHQDKALEKKLAKLN